MSATLLSRSLRAAEAISPQLSEVLAANVRPIDVLAHLAARASERQRIGRGAFIQALRRAVDSAEELRGIGRGSEVDAAAEIGDRLLLGMVG